MVPSGTPPDAHRGPRSHTCFQFGYDRPGSRLHFYGFVDNSEEASNSNLPAQNATATSKGKGKQKCNVNTDKNVSNTISFRRKAEPVDGRELGVAAKIKRSIRPRISPVTDPATEETPPPPTQANPDLTRRIQPWRRVWGGLRGLMPKIRRRSQASDGQRLVIPMTALRGSHGGDEDFH